jgi:hypothetical protein
MSTEQVRSEIDRLLDQMPEENWAEVLAYLRSYTQLNEVQKKRMSLIRKVMRDDANLLDRLAQ